MSSRVARLRRGIVFGRSDRAIHLAALAVIAANGEIVAAAVGRPVDPGWVPVAVAIGVLALAAYLRPVEPAPGEKFSLAAAANVFAALVLPPALAVGSVGSAALVAKVAQRRSLMNTAVNLAQAAGATASTGIVADLIRVDGTLAVVAGGSSYFAVTLGSVGLMIAAAQGLQAARAFIGREALPTAALLGVGGVAAMAWARDPLAIVLFFPVLAAIELAVRRAARTGSATAVAEGDRGGTAVDVAHELRTPLATLVGDLAYIRGALEPSEAKALVSARHQASRLSELVDDLLLLGRLDHSHARAGRSSVLTAARDAIASFPLHERVDLVVEIGPTLAAAMPADLLELAIRDLVSNALAYTLDGAVRVSARAEAEHVVIMVSDTGIGISPEEMPRIFDRFYRGARARELAPGTGLGLAIVRRIVEAHGGDIAIESALSSGTTVTVRLPASTGLGDTRAAKLNRG